MRNNIAQVHSRNIERRKALAAEIREARTELMGNPDLKASTRLRIARYLQKWAQDKKEEMGIFPHRPEQLLKLAAWNRHEAYLLKNTDASHLPCGHQDMMGWREEYHNNNWGLFMGLYNFARKGVK